MTTESFTFDSGTKERIALDLTQQIALAERSGIATFPAAQKTREYWFKLYLESLKAVKGIESKTTA